MKTKFLAAVVLAMGVLGSSTAPASAWGDWLPGWGWGCGYNRNLNIQVSVPYNAFTPFCSGRSVTYGRSNCPNSCGNCGYGNGCGFNGGCGFSNCGYNGFGGGYGPGFCPYMGGWGVGGQCCGPVCAPVCCPSDPCGCAPGATTTTSANGITATPLTAQGETTVPVQMPMTGAPGAMPMGYPMAQPVGYMVPMNYGYYPMHPNYGTYGY